MNYMLAVYSAPYLSQAPERALHFAWAAVKRKHMIKTVFFAKEGVNILLTLKQGDVDLCKQWKDFAQLHQTDLLMCSSAVKKHGFISKDLDGFMISGLGDFVSGVSSVDRFIVFDM